MSGGSKLALELVEILKPLLVGETRIFYEQDKFAKLERVVHSINFQDIQYGMCLAGRKFHCINAKPVNPAFINEGKGLPRRLFILRIV